MYISALTLNGMKTNIYKGSLQTIVMKLLSEKERMYGYEICKSVDQLTQGNLKITEGALYPLLHKLEDQDLYVSTIEISRTEEYIRYYH